MSVKLVRYTSEPLRTVIDAYRKAHCSEEKSDTVCETLGSKDEALLKRCIKLGHLSPLEFIDFEFEVTLSKVADRQLCRHRIASYVGESMRHVEANDYIAPKAIMRSVPALEKYITSMKHSFETYRELMDIGIPMEEARYVLPLGTTGSFLFKMNLRSLRNAIAERTCKDAQTEIRDIFLKIRELVAQIQPIFLYRSEKYYTCESKCGHCMGVMSA